MASTSKQQLPPSESTERNAAAEGGRLPHHPDVKMDDHGNLYIGGPDKGPSPFQRRDPNTRTVSLPVKLVALGEIGADQYHLKQPDTDSRIELTVGINVLRVEQVAVADGKRTTWMTVAPTDISFVKASVNRWEIDKEGSDVLIAVVFAVPKEPVPFVLLFEMDLQHHERTAENVHVLFFDRLVFDHMKAFFESWRERGYCRAEIDPVRALAIPPPGKSFITRKPLPPGYDPHDSKTWIPPFGPVSAEQERLYFDPTPQVAAPVAGPSGAGTNFSKAEEPPAPVFTQSGRAVKRRVANPLTSTTESDGDGKEGGGGSKTARGKKPAKRGRRRSSTSTSPADTLQAPQAAATGDAQAREGLAGTPAEAVDAVVEMDIDQAQDVKPDANPAGRLSSSQDGPTPSQDAAAILIQLMMGMPQAPPVRAPPAAVPASTSDSPAMQAIPAAQSQVEQPNMRPPDTIGGDLSEADAASSRRSRRTSSRPSHMQDYAIFPGARKGRQK